MKRMTVAMLAGGWSAERGISLVSGKAVAGGLKKLPWDSTAFDLVPDGQAASKFKTPTGMRRVALSGLVPALRAARADVVFLCLHGTGGEDGAIQGLLDLAGIPYTGSGVMASAIAMDKACSKRLYQFHGLPTPEWSVAAKGKFRPPFPGPWFVKPLAQGSAVGVNLARNQAQLRRALKTAWRYGGEAMIERLVPGLELTVGVLGSRALPCVQIHPQHEFYDYFSKYAPGGSVHLCPAPISSVLAKKAQALALAAHRALGCRGYSRTDFILHANGGLWILETNTLPGMTPVSLLPDAARVAGYTFEKLLEQMVKLSLE
jgi:D-alanine-D-alanine ligase